MSEKQTNFHIQLSWQDPITGKDVEQLYTLPIKLGRDSSNDVMIPSTSVSRHHAEIVFADDGESVVIQDLGSSNGTYINGETVDQHPLNDGDELVVGDITLRAKFMKGRPKRPSRDYLFGALSDGEAEPTISLSSIRGKSVFADIPSEEERGDETKDSSPTKTPSDINSQTTEKLSGDVLKAFLSGRLQKDIDQDISPDVNVMADSFRRPKSEEQAEKDPQSVPAGKKGAELLAALTQKAKPEDKEKAEQPQQAEQSPTEQPQQAEQPQSEEKVEKAETPPAQAAMPSKSPSSVEPPSDASTELKAPEPAIQNDVPAYKATERTVVKPDPNEPEAPQSSWEKFVASVKRFFGG